VKKTALALWLPVWKRPTTFAELESFILDSQARLPGREARFTAEFARAVRSQGVDSGFAGYQEFRFKMKGARVPWVCSGRYLAVGGTQVHTDAAELLRPADEVGFLDQLQVDVKKGRVHRRLLGKTLDAVENAMSEIEPHRYVTLLECLFEIMSLLSISKRFREAVGHQPTFLPPLPQEPWIEALRGLGSEPEFEIARAVASIIGRVRQNDGTWSSAEPMLGSILPLRLSGANWYLPEPKSPQAVWSGADLCLDLTRVLARRYHDSQTDAAPALGSAYPARLSTVLRFLDGELDDARIARSIEALSLIDWKPIWNAPAFNFSDDCEEEEPARPVPLVFAAVRSLLEVELACANDGVGSRRPYSLRALAFLRERSSSGVAAATSEALYRLGIVGVPNPYGISAREERPRLAGRDIVRLERGNLVVAGPLPARLAAAVCVPLRRRDRFALFRMITIPQDKESK
jgi:CRISPR-associated protein Csx17